MNFHVFVAAVLRFAYSLERGPPQPREARLALIRVRADAGKDARAPAG